MIDELLLDSSFREELEAHRRDESNRLAFLFL
jgi:hypothetical protein